MEIERKFLVKKIPNNIFNCVKITQGYLYYDPEIRIRNIDNKNFYFTLKSNNCSAIRDEYEIEIPDYCYYEMAKGAKSFISKTRSYINLDNGLTAEIDSYDEGLTIVEVEFPTIEMCDKFIPPKWFGEDVTLNSTYKNVNLSRKFHEEKKCKN